MRQHTETCYEHLLMSLSPEVMQKFLEEDELEVLAQYHYEKFRNYMAPLFREEGQEVEDVVSDEITIQMPPIELPASKK